MLPNGPGYTKLDDRLSMFELKKTFTANLGNRGLKKVKGAPYYSKELNRHLFIHPDIENEKHTSVSDEITGYRLFYFTEKHDKIKEEQVETRINEFIKHYTIPAIQEEFQRVEQLISETKKK